MGKKKTCLFISHRLPYPPDKGDKMRSYYMLRGLARHHHVVLGTLIDDAHDLQYKDALSSLVQSHYIGTISHRSRYWAMLKSFFKGTSITQEFFNHKGLRDWIKAQKYDFIYAFSSGVGGYILPLNSPMMIDLVDVDSEKWNGLADKSPFYKAWIYRREARKIKDLEIKMAQKACATFLVTALETKLFQTYLPDLSTIHTHQNGVDLEFWAQARNLPSPYFPDTPIIIFSGAMDYKPNKDAVLWFCDRIFPLIRQHIPNLKFVIAGARPTQQVKNLQNLHDNIVVTGRVDDMRPWLYHATIAVMPLKLARGVQNKILEAMAAQTACVATPQAATGIDLIDGIHIALADREQNFAKSCLDLLQNAKKRHIMAKAGYDLIQKDYSWDFRWQEFDDFLTKLGEAEISKGQWNE